MQYQFTFTSLARNSGLMGAAFETRPIPFSQWATGDFIAVELMKPGSETARIELHNDEDSLIAVGTGAYVVG